MPHKRRRRKPTRKMLKKFAGLGYYKSNKNIQGELNKKLRRWKLHPELSESETKVFVNHLLCF